MWPDFVSRDEWSWIDTILYLKKTKDQSQLGGQLEWQLVISNWASLVVEYIFLQLLSVDIWFFSSNNTELRAISLIRKNYKKVYEVQNDVWSTKIIKSDNLNDHAPDTRSQEPRTKGGDDEVQTAEVPAMRPCTTSCSHWPSHTRPSEHLAFPLKNSWYLTWHVIEHGNTNKLVSSTTMNLNQLFSMM